MKEEKNEEQNKDEDLEGGSERECKGRRGDSSTIKG